MLAVAILDENGNTMGTRIALTLLSTETAAGHCRKNEHRRAAGRMQDLETF